MSFAGIFFRLLIVGIFCKRSFCQDYGTEYLVQLSNVEVREEETGDPIGNYSSAYIHKIKSSDTIIFAMHDLNQTTLLENIFENEEFPSSRLEFVSMYQLQLVFVFQRSNNRVYVFCQFLDESGIQKFFESVNSQKPKNESIKIHKIGRYSISNGSDSVSQMETFAYRAELSVRNMNNSINAVKKVYYISHTSNTNGKVEVDLIFPSARFSLSALYDGNTIVLCVMGISDKHFLIKFSDGENAEKFVKDHMQGMKNKAHCPFPYLSSETINHLNE